MTNQQIDELVDAFYYSDYDTIFEMLDDEKLKSDISASGEIEDFDVQIFHNLMKQIEKEGFEYFYSKLYLSDLCQEMLIGLSDPDKIKKCLNDSTLNLDWDIKNTLVKNLGDCKFLIECFKNNKIPEDEFIAFIIDIGDINYIKECCENRELSFKFWNKILLVEASDPEYIKEFIKENYTDLAERDLADLVIATQDIEYIKFFVFRFSQEYKLKLIKATNDIEYIEECVKNTKLGLTSFGKTYLIELINEESFTKECIFNSSLNLSSNHICELLLNINDKSYIKKCLNDSRLSLTSEDKAKLIIEIGGEKYLQECIDGNELKLTDKVALLYYVQDKDYIKKVLFNEKFMFLPSVTKRDFILSVFGFAGKENSDFIKECIESEKLRLFPSDKVILMKEINDEKYIYDNILSNKLGLTISDKVKLIIFLGKKYIIEFLENKILDFSTEDIKALLWQVTDDEFRKRIINDERYNLTTIEKMQLALTMGISIDVPWTTMFGHNKEYKILLEDTAYYYKKINLPQSMTIGIEIESEGNMSKYIKEQFDYKNWKAEHDGSLTDGVEMISPILHATDDESKQIYCVCDMLNKIGQDVSDSCGGHIHIGADFLKSKQAWANFFEIYCNAEKILYAITNEEGKAPRRGIMRYATPMAPKFQEAIDFGIVNFESETDLDKFVVGLKEIQVLEIRDEYVLADEPQNYDRYFGLNLCNLDNSKNTVEFRLANGTINPDLWIENINLLGGIVAISQELSEIQALEKLTKEQERKIEIFEKLKDDITDKQKLEILIELIKLEPEGYRKRFDANIDLLIDNELLFKKLSSSKPVILKPKSNLKSAEIREMVKNVPIDKVIEADKTLKCAMKDKEIQR